MSNGFGSQGGTDRRSRVRIELVGEKDRSSMGDWKNHLHSLRLYISTLDAANAAHSISRLYVKGRIMGHKRSQRVAKCHTSLIKIEGVEKTEEAKFYFGKRVAYVYKATKEVRGSKIRVIWGRITRSHGNSGVVRAKFAHNIPPQAFAARVRIMLYPSSI
ncbi:hypothetical protein PaG_05796 [Moesziomyces aphidis]|uniref:Uncharacterized protein n=1 Tax=Moesziomyces aphidis TaxID=84754 RepID=W3VFD9_MOEAP|nr:hypothetical protein PaG_05796 [Moesziomyces aphidis]